MGKSIDDIAAELADEEICAYCNYSADCNCGGGVIGGPNGPIYPPCADKDASTYFDMDAYLADQEEED